MALGGLQRGRRSGPDHWPGFVDALSSLLLVIIFLLSMFALAQFFLGQVLSGRDEELKRLNSTISELERSLAMERKESSDLRLNLQQISASLQLANRDRDELQAQVNTLQGKLDDAEARAATNDKQATQISQMQQDAATMQQALSKERALSKAAQDKVDLLNQQLSALREQLASLQAALDASDKRDKEQKAVIVDLGKRLNVALAQKVQELANYRSEFFGELRKVIGNQPGIRIVGDRFVIQAEVLFPSGSAQLTPAGLQQLDKIAAIVDDLGKRIPSNIPWVLRVDGHTDPVPIHTAEFPSNWELSTARATSVVRYLITRGVPPNRLAATGFGEYQPIDTGTGPEANRRNRRIEFKLTER